MSDTSPKEPRDPGVERLLAQVPRPAASPQFKARLREQFLDADISGAPTGPHAIADAPSRERTRAFPFVWPFVLAASVAFILWFVLDRDAHPRWRVLESSSSSEYVVDSVKVPAGDAARLADALQTAREIQTFDAPLRIQLRDDLVLELGPRTQLSRMSFPASGAGYAVYANAGALRVCTGPTFDGNRMRVMTDHMESTVVGTIFSVDVERTGTCLCCLHGTVRCDPRDSGGAKSVEGGQRCFAHYDGTKSTCGNAYEPHTKPLESLRDWAAAHWKKK